MRHTISIWITATGGLIISVLVPVILDITGYDRVLSILISPYLSYLLSLLTLFLAIFVLSLTVKRLRNAILLGSAVGLSKVVLYTGITMFYYPLLRTAFLESNPLPRDASKLVIIVISVELVISLLVALIAVVAARVTQRFLLH